MTPRDPRGPDGDEGNDTDTGEPVHALSTLSVSPEPGFLDLVRRRIYRKSLASQVVELTWHTPFLVLMEWILMAMDFVWGREAQKEGESRDE